MSDEYRLLIEPMLDLLELATPIEKLGLRPVASTSDSLRFAYPSTPQEQVARWGGNVIVERESDGTLRITLNGISGRLALAAIAEHIGGLGGTVTVDDL